MARAAATDDRRRVILERMLRAGPWAEHAHTQAKHAAGPITRTRQKGGDEVLGASRCPLREDVPLPVIDRLPDVSC